MGDRAARVGAVVLAAGEGKRLKSDLPKVLHRIAGRPLLAHALFAIAPLGVDRTVVVASARRDEIAAALDASGCAQGVEYVIQDPPRGTGDAVAVALGALGEDVDTLLVTLGDAPLLRSETLQALLDEYHRSDASAVMLTALAPEGTDLGRVIRRDDGSVDRIVEVRDATPRELEVREVNSGVCVFSADRLADVLPRISPANAQGEYYLTDAIALLRSDGDEIRTSSAGIEETMGVNDRIQLAEVGAALRRRVAEAWMLEGISVEDPDSTYIDATVEIGPGAVVRPGTFLEGDTRIGAHAQVGPQTRIVDSSIGERAEVSFSVVRGSDVGPEASVGPFASLRPGTKLARRAKLGTFVESKNARLGEDSKANHLAYLGDAELGEGVNVGAGTITCNWDGREKHSTTIDDDAYIGSDTMLVAPVHIGEGAATGAGAVVRGEVPPGSLAVGVPARIIEGKGNKMKKSDEDQQPG